MTCKSTWFEGGEESYESALLAFNDLCRAAELRSYDDQREFVVEVLAEAAGIQCYTSETLRELIIALIENVRDGTVDNDWLMEKLESHA